MKNVPVISKERILGYLEYAPEKMDLYKFVCWLETASEGYFYLVKGRRPNLSINKQLNRNG